MDPTQLDQILANLCVNARDAIDDVGEVKITTGQHSFDPAYCAAHAGYLPGEFVSIAVQDTGCGMDASTQQHIFEPFFTTKETGQGTGLGLATVYGAVRQNHGFVRVVSEPGKGSTFTVYLPRTASPPAGETRRDADESGLRGQETILLVEDEPAVLRLASRILQRQGYEVIAAGTPGEAQQSARERSADIRLLITDVIMPEMNGRDLAEEVKFVCPSAKVLFMSGYTADTIGHHGVLEEGTAFIQKPFEPAAFQTKVRRILDGLEPA
jgi:CheY-like chemotaxis protein